MSEPFDTAPFMVGPDLLRVRDHNLTFAEPSLGTSYLIFFCLSRAWDERILFLFLMCPCLAHYPYKCTDITYCN